MRRKHRFVLTARALLPDHWHAIIYPPHPPSISRVFQAVKAYAGIAREEQERRCGLSIDRVRLPADENARI